MLEAEVAAGYHRADRFHRFLEIGQDDLLVDPRFPDYATDRTDPFMVVEVIISSGKPTETAATIADKAVRLLGERLHLAPRDILFVFHEVEPNLPRFPAASRGDLHLIAFRLSQRRLVAGSIAAIPGFRKGTSEVRMLPVRDQGLDA